MADEFDNKVNAVLDEIALEGLDGITLEGLWVRLSDRPDFQDVVDDVTKHSIWDIIISLDDIEMYELSTPRAPLVIFNRYDFVDPELGIVLEPESMPEDIYTHKSVEDEKKQIRGSCSTYLSRSRVYDEAACLSLDEVINKWGNSLVLVASQQTREAALMGSSADPELELTIIQYCMLERIGRSRYLGEVTQGRISLQIMGEEPKALFYHRKFLTRHGLVIKQIHHQKAGTQNCSGSLLHLPRFYVERRPKVLYLTERVVEILKSRPNCIAEYDEIRKELAITNSLKKLFQTLHFQRFVRTDLRLPYRILYPDAKISEWKLKGNDKEKMIRVIQLIDPNTDLEEISARDDEMDFVEEDDDDIGPSEDFRIALNRSYLYQAYECIVSAGHEGFSQMELGAKLGATKLHSRTVSRNLLKRGIASTFMNDVGRQRVSRFRSKECTRKNPVSERRAKLARSRFKESTKNSQDMVENLVDNRENPGERKLQLSKENIEHHKEVITKKTSTNESEKSLINDKASQLPQQVPGAITLTKQKSNTADNGVLSKLPPKKRALAEAQDREFPNKKQKSDPSTEQFSTVSNLPLQMTVSNPEHSSVVTSAGDSNSSVKSMSPDYKLSISSKPRAESELDGSSKLQPDKTSDDDCAKGVQRTQVESLVACASPQLYQSSCSSPDVSQSRSNSPDPFSISSQISQGSFDLEQKAKTAVGQQNLIKWVENINENAFDVADNSYSPMGDKLLTKGDENKPYFDQQKRETYCMTQRIFTRINLILDYVRSQKVIDDYSKLLKLINEEEEKERLGMKIDKKSLLRLIFRLQEDGYLNVFSYILTDGVKEKVIFFICEKSICFGHSIIQSSIEQAKMKMFIVNKENMVNVPNTGDAAFQEACAKRLNELRAMCPSKKQKITFVYDKKIGKKYGFCPKFIRMRTLHQFLFYLIYGYEGDENLNQKEVLEYFVEKGVEVNEALTSEMPRIFAKDLHWKMFIPPLQIHAGWPSGWTIMCDILLRLPLSIFVKIFNVSYIVPGLENYLNHPIRKHFLVKHMPNQLRNCLTAARKYIFSIHEVLTRLCYIGLIQFGPQRLKEKDQVSIYLNRRTTLLDTVPSKPGYHQISAEVYAKRSYEFIAMSEVDKYWYEMWNICLHTQLGGRICVTGKDIILEALQNKPAMLNAIQSRNPDEAPLYDLGNVPGDKKGAGGLDSAIFSHLKRNWNWTNTHNSSASNQPLPVQGMDKRKARLANVKCVPVVFNKYTGIVKKSINYLQSGKFSKITKQEKKPVMPVKMIDPEIKPVPLPKRVTECKNIVRHITARKNRASSRPYYDDVDMHALQMMSKLRVEWSRAEDNLLLICKVASMYLCPNPRQQVISINVIRDVLHKAIPASKNKTSRACQRRILYMMKNLTTSNNVAMHLEEVRQDAAINKKFKNTFSDMRIVADSSEELEILMNEKFKMLVNLLKTKSDNLMPEYRVYCTTIPDTTSQFWEMFDVIKPNKALKAKGQFQQVKNVVDIKCGVVNTIINSSLCCLSDKTSWAYQLFKVYQQYPDNLLRSAMAKIRADQMVSLKKSYVHLVTKSGNYLPLSSSPYQLSISYLHLIQTKYQYRIFHESYQMARKLLEWNKSSEGEDMKVEIGNGGSTATLVELLHKNQISFRAEIPEQVIILDPRISELDESYARIVERYRDILQNYKPGKEYTSSSLFKKNYDNVEEDECEISFTEECDESSKEVIITSEESEFSSKESLISEEIENGNSIMDSKESDVETVSEKSDILEQFESKESTQTKESEDGMNKADTEDPELSEFPLVDIEFEESEAPPSSSQQSVLARTASRIALFMMREELEETTVGTNQHAHDFFVVNACQVFCNLTSPSSEPNQVNENFILPFENDVVNRVLESLKKNLLIPYKQVTEEQVKEILLENGASPLDCDLSRQIIAYVAERKEIGATLKQIRVNFFHKRRDMSLAKMLNLLVDSKIFLRSGVTTVHYIHHSYIHPWLAHTFKLLRLDREKLEPSQVKVIHLEGSPDEDCIMNENIRNSDASSEICDIEVDTEEQMEDSVVVSNEIDAENQRNDISAERICKNNEIDAETLRNEEETHYKHENKEDQIDTSESNTLDVPISVSNIEGIKSNEKLNENASISAVEEMDIDLQIETSQEAPNITPDHSVVKCLQSSTEEQLDNTSKHANSENVPVGDMNISNAVTVDNSKDSSLSNSEQDVKQSCIVDNSARSSNVSKVIHKEKLNDGVNHSENTQCKSTKQNQDGSDHTYHKSPKLTKSLCKKLRFRTCSNEEFGHAVENPDMMQYRAQRKAFVEARKMKRAAEKINFEASEKIQVAIRPWVRINGSLNRRVLDRMLGALLGHSMFQPGQTVQEFGNRFSPALQPFHVRELLEILQKLGCVKFLVGRLSCKATLFSQPSVFHLEEADGTEDEVDIIVEPQPDAVLKLGQFIGNKSYARDFMSS